jgi:hypothetical protein
VRGAGELGAVAGHEARVGGHVVPGAGPARGSLLREAEDAIRREDAHGPRRHPQELDAQGHLHLAPQLRGLPLMAPRSRPGPTFYRSGTGTATATWQPGRFAASSSHR